MSSAKLRFRDYELDREAFELRRAGHRIRLERKPMELLIFLAEKPGRLVSRDEIIEKIWGKNFSFDAENGVNNAIRKIRAALNDGSEDPRYVETVVGKGYRFISPVDEIPSSVPVPIGTSASRSSRSQPPRSLIWILTGSVAVLAASFLIYHGAVGKKAAAHAASSIHSIAVLPLANLSGDSSEDYFAEGMTELLTTDLGRIGQIRVISRTSAMRYKGTTKTIPQIARELNVDAVIEGGVARSGDHLRITAQLIQAQSDQHLWADAYEGDVRDAFSLQDKVALDIAERVQARFSNAENSKAATTIDPVAEEEYFRGRYDSSRWTAAELESSVGHFEQAVQRDPRCAPAWAGLAGDYELMGVFGYLPRRTAVAQALTAAQRAVGLDSSLADAHVYLATARWRTAWLPSGSAESARQAWSDAEKELRFAVSLNPNDAVAHQWLGYHLATAGQFENAIVEMQRARELDPLSPNTQNSLGAAYYWAGHDEEALREFSQVPDPDANSERRHQRMARIYERKGTLGRAAEELATAARLAGKPALATSVEREYRSSGLREARRRYLQGEIVALQHPPKDHGVSVAALEIAADHALLGQKAPSLRWLEKAWQQDDSGLEFLKIDDRFEILRGNPRFQDLLVRLGLPPS